MFWAGHRKLVPTPAVAGLRGSCPPCSEAPPPSSWWSVPGSWEGWGTGSTACYSRRGRYATCSTSHPLFLCGTEKKNKTCIKKDNYQINVWYLIIHCLACNIGKHLFTLQARHLGPLSIKSNGDLSKWVKNPWVRRKTPKKQTSYPASGRPATTGWGGFQEPGAGRYSP